MSPKRPSSVDIAVTFQQVQKYEIGANRIGTGRLVKAAAILGVPIAALLEGADGPDPGRSLVFLVADRRSFRLARAFRAITDGALRLSIVSLVEKIASTVPQPQRRRR